MSNKILIENGWQQRIRDKLGVDISYLPDSVIEQPDYITIAESKIIKSIPDYENLADDEKIFLEAAVVCECARLLCPTMKTRLPVVEQGPAFKVELSTDWDKMALDLLEEVQINLGNISDEIYSDVFYGFDISGRD